MYPLKLTALIPSCIQVLIQKFDKNKNLCPEYMLIPIIPSLLYAQT